MPRGHKITKTTIRSRKEPIDKIVRSIIMQGKNLESQKDIRRSYNLFHKFIVERQSMKKAVALIKWRKFIETKLKKQKA